MTTKTLRGFVALVVLTAAASLVLLPGMEMGRDPTTLVVLALLSALAGARPIRFAGLRTSLTATHPVILCAVAMLGPGPAVLVALSGVVGTLIATERPMHRVRLAFNLGSVALSTLLASVAFHQLGGVIADRLTDMLGPLLGATAVFFLANTGLVATAVRLEKRRPFLQTWRETFGWTAASYFMGLTVAAGLTLALQVLGSWGVVLLLPPLWLLSEHYRAQRERLAEKRLRVEHVETLNTQLERNVGELEEALTRVKRLEGLLPICSHCKKIRDRGDEWHRLERYLADHSDARFTHSVCPECREEHFSPAMVQRDIEES